MTNRNNPEHWKQRMITGARQSAAGAQKRIFLCRECPTEIDAKQAQTYGVCEECRQKHKAAWKEEHTRKENDKRKGWLIGDLCTVKLRDQQYDAKIIDMSDISRRENNYDLVKLELTKTVKGLDGKEHTQTWVHPEPVQTYKLKKRYVS